MGVLSADTTIAHAVTIAGWIGMLAAWLWLGWRWLNPLARGPHV